MPKASTHYINCTVNVREKFKGGKDEEEKPFFNETHADELYVEREGSSLTGAIIEPSIREVLEYN